MPAMADSDDSKVADAIAEKTDDLQARLEAARAYESATPVAKMMDDMIAEIKKNPAIAGDSEILGIMYDAFDQDALRENVIQSMAKHFTVAELNALSEFYSTPEGQSILKKMAPYMSDVMPLIQAEVFKGIAAVQKAQADKAAAAAKQEAE